MTLEQNAAVVAALSKVPEHAGAHAYDALKATMRNERRGQGNGLPHAAPRPSNSGAQGRVGVYPRG